MTYSTLSNQAVCGADLTLDFGEIASPGYPNPYATQAECVWKIIVGTGDHIQFQFLNIDLEDTYFDNCRRNFIQVRVSEVNSTLIFVSVGITQK